MYAESQIPGERSNHPRVQALNILPNFYKAAKLPGHLLPWPSLTWISMANMQSRKDDYAVHQLEVFSVHNLMYYYYAFRNLLSRAVKWTKAYNEIQPLILILFFPKS